MVKTLISFFFFETMRQILFKKLNIMHWALLSQYDGIYKPSYPEGTRLGVAVIPNTKKEGEI